jgi:hypothetical protein
VSLIESGETIQYTVDPHGTITAVIVPQALWQRILDALEDSEDRALVQTLRARLALGPAAGGALRWDAVSTEW